MKRKARRSQADLANFKKRVGARLSQHLNDAAGSACVC
jgi:hypothetical protein